MGRSAKLYHPREHKDLGCLIEETGDSHQQNQGIRLVKTQRQPSLCGVEKFSFNGFEVVTVNAQGQEIQRRREISGYFTENLGKEIDLDLVYIPVLLKLKRVVVRLNDLNIKLLFVPSSWGNIL